MIQKQLMESDGSLGFTTYEMIYDNYYYYYFVPDPSYIPLSISSRSEIFSSIFKLIEFIRIKNDQKARTFE